MDKKVYDLEERTTKLGVNVIKFVARIPRTILSETVIIQLIRSATSVGANYCEADDAESRRDFRHQIGICKKEARETKYWLHIAVTVAPNLKPEASALWRE